MGVEGGNRKNTDIEGIRGVCNVLESLRKYVLLLTLVSGPCITVLCVLQ